MILTDTKILEEIERGTIVISPFDRLNLGTNSYDVHLGKHLAVYRNEVLDAKIQEYTETHRHVPFLEGKSSIGRLGIDIHATAGKGDIGFCNTWTLEISVKQSVRVYHGMPIGQLIYFEVSGEVGTTYRSKSSAKYAMRTDRPVESMMYKNFQKKAKG
jgi:dCTP deaminase